MKKNIKIFLKPRRVTENHRKDLTQRNRGQLLAYDIALDLGLIQIEQFDGSLVWIEFADSERVVVGDQVYALVIPSREASIRLFVLKMHLFDGKRGTPEPKNNFVFTLMPLRRSTLDPSLP